MKKTLLIKCIMTDNEEGMYKLDNGINQKHKKIVWRKWDQIHKVNHSEIIFSLKYIVVEVSNKKRLDMM